MGVENIQGINVKKGLSMVANNKTVYARLLKSFINNNFCDQLIEAICCGDIDQVRQKAHTLKGVAGNMHMEELFELSRSIEAGAKDGAALSSTDELVSRIIDANRQTSESVTLLLNNPNMLDSYS